MLTGLHILLTYRCTHQCDHCFVRSGPGAKGTFTLSILEDLLDEAVRIGTVSSVYFEGGEPFLLYPLLLAGAGAARDRGFSVGIVTNAYWAETTEDAALWLRPLADIGIDGLTVSRDSFHGGDEAGGPPERAAAAARKLWIDVGTICTPRPEEGEGVRFRGRAADELVGDAPRHPLSEFTTCPDEDFADPGRVHVDAYGNVHLCQGVLMGNFLKRPLSEIVRDWDAAADPVSGPLHAGGPAALAAAHAVETDPDGYASACHACYEIRRRLLDAHPAALGPPQVYRD